MTDSKISLESAILNPDPKSSQALMADINGGPGVHRDGDSSSQLGRDAPFIALRYR